MLITTGLHMALDTDIRAIKGETCWFLTIGEATLYIQHEDKEILVNKLMSVCREILGEDEESEAQRYYVKVPKPPE